MMKKQLTKHLVQLILNSKLEIKSLRVRGNRNYKDCEAMVPRMAITIQKIIYILDLKTLFVYFYNFLKNHLVCRKKQKQINPYHYLQNQTLVKVGELDCEKLRIRSIGNCLKNFF